MKLAHACFHQTLQRVFSLLSIVFESYQIYFSFSLFFHIALYLHACFKRNVLHGACLEAVQISKYLNVNNGA